MAINNSKTGDVTFNQITREVLEMGLRGSERKYGDISVERSREALVFVAGGRARIAVAATNELVRRMRSEGMLPPDHDPVYP